jgi:hypothetical protein
VTALWAWIFPDLRRAATPETQADNAPRADAEIMEEVQEERAAQ